MRKSSILIFLLSIYILANCQILTQFTHYSVDDGLSENNVLSMLQDKKGNMWFGTYDGLNKFDGYTFKAYKGEAYQPFRLINYRIDRIKEDTQGFLWLQTYDGRTYRFDPSTENFLPVPQCVDEYKNFNTALKNIYTLNDGATWITGGSPGSENCFRIENRKTPEKIKITRYCTSNGSLTSNKVNKIYLDRHQNTWILTANGLNFLQKRNLQMTQFFTEKTGGGSFSIFENKTVIYIGGEQGKLRVYNPGKSTFDLIKTPFTAKIIEITQISQHELFLLTDVSGFYIYNTSTDQFQSFNKENGSGLKSDLFFGCYKDKKNNIWLDTNNPSVVYFETKTRKINNFVVTVDRSNPVTIAPNFIAFEDKFNNIWIHPRSGGFCKYDSITKQLEPFYNKPKTTDRKFSNIIHSALTDRQGNLWISSHSQGIEKIVFRRSPFTFIKPDQTSTSSNNNEIRSVYQDRDNWLWVGSRKGFVYLYDEKGIFKGNMGFDGKINGNMPFTVPVYSIMSDHDGNIWLATRGLGLFKVVKSYKNNTTSFTITNFRFNPKDIYSLSSDAVYHVFEDHMQRIWIATYGGGLNLLDTSTGECRFISNRNKLRNYPIQECSKARYIAEDSRHHIFVGTTEGLVAFKSDNKRPEDICFQYYHHNPREQYSLSGNDVQYILPSKKGNLYLALFGGGLNILKGEFSLTKRPEFVVFKKNDGISSNVIYTLKEDAKGNIWLSTQTKIVKYDPLNLKFNIYSPISTSNYHFIEATACKTNQGDLIYGTSQGLVRFNPLKAINSKYIPPIVFTQLQLFSKVVEAGAEGSPLEKVIDDTSELVLTHKQNIFSIGFAAIDYVDPQKIQYAYKLEGFENDWNYVGTQLIATYTNLPKGKYIFHVKSTNSDGEWAENDRTIQITKLPSFWESAWGLLFYLILFIILSALTAYIIFTIYRLRNEVDVEHRITNMKLRFFTDISHELRTPLTLISSPIENILENEVLSVKAKNQLQIVQRNTDRMVRLINQILDFRKIQNGKMKLIIEDIHVNEFMGEICQNFTKLANDRNVELNIFDFNSDVHLWVDKDKFEKIFYNLLSNAFKFTQQGSTVEVIISENEAEVIITVKDKGMGISKDKLKFLFERFESFASTNITFQASTGIGLSLTKELVELHHAKINVESETGKGSEFHVHFKKGVEHYTENDDFILQDLKQNDGIKDLSDSNDTDKLGNVVEINQISERPLILIAEDNYELRSFLKSILDINYEVLEAENGRKALEMALTFLPDIIISDIMMPEINGLELAKAIKENINISHIPLVLLTAKTDNESKLEALQYGVDDYITKPFSSVYLEARIENLLKLRKQLQTFYRTSLTSGVISISKPTLTNQDEIFIQRTMKYIEEKFENPELNIDDIAIELGVSRSSFFKKLKSLTGIAPVDFIKEIRIQRAVQLIEAGESNISQIAYTIGMNDPRYFSKCFKQKYGMTPSEYREKFQKENSKNV